MKIFKILIFDDDRVKTLGTYATPLETSVKQYEWFGGEIPTLMNLKATMKDLNKLYPKLDFTGIKLIPVILKEFPTNKS